MRLTFLALVYTLLCLTTVVMSRPNPNDVKTVAMNRPDPNYQSSNPVLTSLVISKPNSHDLTNPEPGIKSSKPGIMYKKLLGKIFGGNLDSLYKSNMMSLCLYVCV